MNPTLALILTACLVIAGHTMAFEDEQAASAVSDTTCSTDSECGCVYDCLEPASEPVIADTLPFLINEWE